MGLVAASLTSLSSLSFFLPLIPPMQQEKLWYYVKRCVDWIVGFISLNSNGFLIWPFLQRVVLKEKKIYKPMKKNSKDDSFTNLSKIRLLSFQAWGNCAQSEWEFLSGKEGEQSGSAGVNLTGLRITLMSSVTTFLVIWIRYIETTFKFKETWKYLLTNEQKHQRDHIIPKRNKDG